MKKILRAMAFGAALSVATIPGTTIQPAQACSIICSNVFWGEMAVDVCLATGWEWSCEIGGAYIGGL